MNNYAYSKTVSYVLRMIVDIAKAEVLSMGEIHPQWVILVFRW